MSHTTNYQALITRGRKAGLNTRELYLAMATLRVEDSSGPGQSDGNGYVSSMTQQGHRVYRPVDGLPRS